MVRKLCFSNVLLLLVATGAVRSFVTYPKTSSNTNEVQDDINYLAYRLPKEIVPISYTVWIYTKLGINDFTYKGHVTVEIEVLNATNTVIMHNDGLIVEQSETVIYTEAEEPGTIIIHFIDSQYYDKEKQFYIVKCSEMLEPGIHFLELHFEGEIRDDVFGFYRTSYVDNGKKKWMGVTQFSPTYARRAFLCMDEPHMKANFTLHIGHAANQTVTSNTQIEKSVKDSNNSDYCITSFTQTPRMSTYLVGWAVHDFISETSTLSKNFKLWMRKPMAGRGLVALNHGLSIYSFLNDWFQIRNPISKMDQVAVADFYFHAMENWGMITYTESVVLFESDDISTGSMIDGLTTMGHEYTHTWFGNLVTPIFWNVAWLKEGFATYFAYFALNAVQPDWKVMDKFVVNVLQPTLLLDAGEQNRVMNGRNVGSPSSIMDVLDFVSYKKGSSVIRMLSHVTGKFAFQSGLQSYLRNMSYGAASPFDLYKHLQASTDKSIEFHSNIRIADMMETWTNQPGYPLVTVNRNYTTQIVTVTQNRFYPKNDNTTAKENASNWWIPISLVEKSYINEFSQTAPRFWLKPGESLSMQSVSSDDWVIFNVQQVGYYRVNYDMRNWRMLIDYLKSKDFLKIHKLNRAALIDDAFNLAKAGYIDYRIPFDLSDYLIQEFAYEPWVAATNNFEYLNKMLSSTPDVRRVFQEHVIRLIESIYNQLSFSEASDEDITTKLLRETILSISCSLQYSHCLWSSENLFRKWISSSNERIPKNVKSFVYCEGIRKGNEEDWYTTWDRLLLTDLQSEQEILIPALGCTGNPSLNEKYLGWSISEEYSFRKQYRITIINSILNGNAKNVEQVLEFVRNNLQKIISLRGYDFLRKVIRGIGNAMTTEEQTNKLRVFVNENIQKLGEALRTAKLAINAASANAEWVKKYSTIIAHSLN